MAGDPLHAAFLAHLTAELAECGFMLPWTVKDTRNTVENPDASEPFVTFEIIPGATTQFTTGAPGFNLFQENGQVTVRVFCRIARNRNTAESYAATIRNAFRARKFACGSATIRITDTAPMGGGVIRSRSPTMTAVGQPKCGSSASSDTGSPMNCSSE